MSSMGDNIRAERARRNITQKELADAIGVSKTSIYLYETGRAVPAADKVKRIAGALGVSVSDIIERG